MSRNVEEHGPEDLPIIAPQLLSVLDGSVGECPESNSWPTASITGPTRERMPHGLTAIS